MSAQFQIRLKVEGCSFHCVSMREISLAGILIGDKLLAAFGAKIHPFRSSVPVQICVEMLSSVTEALKLLVRIIQDPKARIFSSLLM